MKYLTLSRVQQLYVGLVLLVVIPIVLGLVFQYQLYDFYLDQFERPRLERQFGFTSGTLQIPGQPPSHPQFAVVDVRPDGALAKAGFRPGDMPVGYKHGFSTGFYQALLAVREGNAVYVHVLAASDYGQGISAWRRVRIDPSMAR